MQSVAEFLEESGGFATTGQLLTVISQGQLYRHVRSGRLVRVWHGVYAAQQPDLLGRLAALDLFLGRHAVVCMGTAARLYGFDLENTTAVHMLDPGVRVRSTIGLIVHQRVGAVLRVVSGRMVTAPAWTAVEVARGLPRARALATLDAALRTRLCSAADLEQAVFEQRSRPGIVAVRELLPHADGRSESAMESETRLVIIDSDLPAPQLQYPIRDRDGRWWRVDSAWPEAKVAVEYESVEWHADPAKMIRDKSRLAAIQEAGWTVIPAVSDDIRRNPERLIRRIAFHLSGMAALN